MGQKAAAGGGVVGGGRAGGRRRGILLNFRTVRSRHILSVGALICIFFSRRPGAFAPRRGPKAPITAGIRSPVHLSDLCRLFDWVWNTPFEALVRVKARKQHRSAFSVFFSRPGDCCFPLCPRFYKNVGNSRLAPALLFVSFSPELTRRIQPFLNSPLPPPPACCATNRRAE